MNIQKTGVNTQPKTNLEKTVKVAGKAAGVYGAMAAASTAGMVAIAKKNPDIFISAAEMLADGCTTALDGNMVESLTKGYKKLFSEMAEEVPKRYKKLFNPNEKVIKDASERIANLVNVSQGGKANLKFFAKDVLKVAAKGGAIVGGIYLVGKTIYDHIQAKKANKNQ
ncbi:hypothetical protein IJD15_07165 [bacterium]|nr:hypothetical protein [bacterium]